MNTFYTKTPCNFLNFLNDNLNNYLLIKFNLFVLKLNLTNSQIAK